MSGKNIVKLREFSSFRVCVAHVVELSSVIRIGYHEWRWRSWRRGAAVPREHSEERGVGTAGEMDGLTSVHGGRAVAAD